MKLFKNHGKTNVLFAAKESWNVDYEQFLLKRYEHWSIYLHQNQTYLGRCYVALNREGDIDPFLQCTQAEWDELLNLIMADIAAVLDHLFQPSMFNYANLRNEWRQCHWHVVPRYEETRVFAGRIFSDPNWGHNWAPYPKQDFCNEETKFAIRDAMRAAFGPSPTL